ncbi:MAG: CRTAC1 family protein [Planctomycetes bacterium]|nr:CRTAC1 family protein [Planctomycetota bacterium]
MPDVAAEAGIDFLHVHGGRNKKYLFETMGSGVAVVDLDGDALPEILFLQSGTLPPDEFTPDELEKAPFAAGETSKLYRNEGGLHFSDVTAGSGFDIAFYAQGLAVGDVDADGDRDVYVAAYGRDRLFLNDDALRFRDVTNAAGVEDPRWTIGGAFLDADNDGDLDLYVIGYLDMPIESHRFCGPNKELRTYCHVDSWDGLDDRLLLNDGHGRFTDGSAAASLVGTKGKGLALVGGDYDDDGDVDLFVANDSQANLMLRNDGGGRFTEVGRMSGADLNGEGRTEACMGTDMGDLDQDGDLDMYVVNFQQETNTLYRNDGGGFFTDVSVRSGAGAPSLSSLGFGTVFFDLENDGDLDIYVANGHILDNVDQIEELTTFAQDDQLFLNDGHGRFSPADPSLGTSLHEPRVGRGVARADLDRDGDVDLVVSNNSGRPWVLRNDAATGHRIVLRLQGPGGRADAEGARVGVRTARGPIVRELVCGGSYESASDPELVIGLGTLEAVEGVSVRWPGGSTSDLGVLDVDARYTVAFDGTILQRELLPPPGRSP